MAATHRTERNEDGAHLLDAVVEASFVELVCAPTVQSILGTGILVRLLTELQVPFHLRLGVTVDFDEQPETTHVAVGAQSEDPSINVIESDVLRRDAERLATSLNVHVPSWLTQTAQFASGAANADVDDDVAHHRTSGVGCAVPDLVDGLTYSTLIHGPFSGNRDEAEALLAGIDANDGRTIASVIIHSVVSTFPGRKRVAEAVQRVINPVSCEDGPFETIPGTFDVFDTLIETDPGNALAIACGAGDIDGAITSWKTAAQSLHEFLEQLQSTEEAVFEIETTNDVPIGPCLRLVRAYFVTNGIVVVRNKADRVGIVGTEMEDSIVQATIDSHMHDPVIHGDGRITGTLSTDPAQLRADLEAVVV